VERCRGPLTCRPMIARLGERLLDAVDRRGWVTWERTHDGARVLMVTNAWPRPENPIHGIFVVGMVDGLREQGLDADVLFIRGYRGVYCYLLACLVMMLLPVVRRGKYLLVNSHGGEAALAARFFLGRPVIASYWGSDILGPQQGDRRTRCKLFLVSRALRAHAPLMTATSTKSKEMQEKLPRRARARNWVIPDGVDRDRFIPIDREHARRLTGWPLDEVTVISVGRPVALKRLWLAEHAVVLAAAEIPGLRWRLVSDVAPQDMPAIYNAADCLIHTSVSEGSPNAVKEALACNLPVVATPSGDIRELLEGVHPSAVCPPEPSALSREIVACVSGRRSDGRAHTAHLGREQIAMRLADCYHSLRLPVSD
jgi:glycosyltransferase involved in cell wall biosynthesis